MSNTAKIAIPLLLLTALAGGGLYVMSLERGSTTAPPSPPPVAPVEAPKDPQQPAPVSAEPLAPPPQEPQRTDVSANGQSDAPQGVRGRVVLPDGRPGAGIDVMLVTNIMANPTAIFLMNAKGKGTPPLAQSTTAADGSFALGLRQPDILCDLRILSPDYPERNLGRLKVREGDWFDAGEVRLDVGLVVQGRVVENGTNAPVAGATVYMIQSNQSHAMLTTPGRERGAPTTTDANGHFRFTNGPQLGVINLTVDAPGYASSPLVNLPLKHDAPNEFTIEVVRGAPIAGVVVDASGKPIAGVSIQATGHSSKTPQNATTVSRDDGTFEFQTLRAGPYSLQANMGGYLDAAEPLVMTGSLDVKLVLGTRAFAKVRVFAASGAPIKNFRVGLTRYFANNPQGVGKVMDWPDKDVTARDYPRDLGGQWAVLQGLPTGEFRLLVADDAHAKTLSEPFAIVEGKDAPEVTVQMTLGGVIVGTVQDDSGRPVAGATVSTDMNAGAAVDLGGIFEHFRQMMPERHTKAQVQTDAQGRFRFTKLAFAEYMVRVTHPNFCEGMAMSIKLDKPGQEADVGVITLSLGAQIEGVTMVAGQPQGQVTVTLSTPLSESHPPGAGTSQPITPVQPPKIFHTKAISGGDGRYRMLKRVPPGTYRISASRQSGENPFFAIVDIKETEQQLVVAPGQQHIELNFGLSKR